MATISKSDCSQPPSGGGYNAKREMHASLLETAFQTSGIAVGQVVGNTGRIEA